ncbi:hypothetical protein OAA83_02225 [Candidatus Marinimicrobia bacterium]|nr:hypothetical protein [Candidatus Neomarinimicrobiota bacterium]
MTKRIKKLLIYGFWSLSILLFNGCSDAEEEKIDEEFIVPKNQS